MSVLFKYDNYFTREAIECVQCGVLTEKEWVICRDVLIGKKSKFSYFCKMVLIQILNSHMWLVTCIERYLQ